MSNLPPINHEATRHEPIVSETLKDGVRKNREQIAEARRHDGKSEETHSRAGTDEEESTSRPGQL